MCFIQFIFLTSFLISLLKFGRRFFSLMRSSKLYSKYITHQDKSMGGSINGSGGHIPPHISDFCIFNINFKVLNYNIC